MNEQTQAPEVDTDEDDAPFAWSQPDWCQIRPDWDDGVPRDDTIGIVDSLSHLRSRLRALGDVLSSADSSTLYGDTAAYIGHIIDDYTQQLEDFGELVHSRYRERDRAKLATPKVDKPADPLADLRDFKAAAATVIGWGQENLVKHAEKVRAHLAAKVEAGQRAAADLGEAEAIIAELEARS